jgi:hypothetical protein
MKLRAVGVRAIPSIFVGTTGVVVVMNLDE